MTETTNTPRPPEGDWLGTQYLRFTREGAFGVCTLDRPEARNAMTPAMYFGIRYAVRHVDADPDLAGLLITGTGDVFAGVLAAGWPDGHEVALRRACAAGALATLVPGAGDCAPYADAIDDAVSNRKASEGHL